MNKFLKLFARRIPSYIISPARRIWSHPRYWMQRFRGRAAFFRYSQCYQHPVLFIAGLPKSGTSWLESMLAEFPGYTVVMPPEAVAHELSYSGSHAFEMPRNLFDRLENTLSVMKLHVHGSSGNARLLKDRGIPFVVMFRDLRDVAVSHYFYVRQTPWHPEFSDYSQLGVEEGLLYFCNTLLEPFVDWIRSWARHADTDLCHTLRYEELLNDPESELAAVCHHFGLKASSDTIKEIVSRHSFEQQSGGRVRGEEDTSSFYRKGISGDWRNHFSAEVEEVFQDKAGELLVDLGYEKDSDWAKMRNSNMYTQDEPVE